MGPKIVQDYSELARSAAPTSQTNASSNHLHGFHVERNPLACRTIAPGSFTQVKLEMRGADVTIHPGTEFQVKVTDFRDQPIDVKVINQTLLVKENSPASPKHIISFSWRNDSGRVDITVPRPDALVKVSGHSHNGDLILQNLQLQNMTLDLDNGDVLLNNANVAEELIVASKEGDIAISQSKISTASLRMHDGDVTLRRSLLKQAMLQTCTGNINIAQCHANLNLEARESDISIAQSQLTGENLIKATEGDLILRAIVHDISYQLATKAGDIIYHRSNIGRNFASPSDQSDSLQARLEDGDIVIH
ncbi:hypothetical protein EQ500_02490 [Lactobacillus sp. XV13L]|nr:hypothetical protein [Lactobacillus sp. XV13L]